MVPFERAFVSEFYRPSIVTFPLYDRPTSRQLGLRSCRAIDSPLLVQIISLTRTRPTVMIIPSRQRLETTVPATNSLFVPAVRLCTRRRTFPVNPVTGACIWNQIHFLLGTPAAI